MDYYHENPSSVAGIMLQALHESSYFFSIILWERYKYYSYFIEREKTWRNLLALLTPCGLCTLAVFFFSCFSSSKIYAHSLFHFPIMTCKEIITYTETMPKIPGAQ